MKLGSLTRAEVDEILRTQTIARLACQDGERPYVVPVAYAWDGEAIYVHSLPGTKIESMRKHPQVCVQVDRIDGMTSWRSVVAWGKYDELHGEQARSALTLLVERLIPRGVPSNVADPFAPPSMADRAILFRVQLDERVGRFASP
jgi:uncharacterized protein